jgi:hypothetical protein
MKRSWLLRLTPEQFAKLHAGLHSHFRFYLNLSFETVTYTGVTLAVHVPKDNESVNQRISDYINGYAAAICP